MKIHPISLFLKLLTIACLVLGSSQIHGADSRDLRPRVILVGGTDSLLLLTDDYATVRNALNLTPAQQADLEKLAADIREFEKQIANSDAKTVALNPAFQAFRSNADRRLDKILTSDQWEKLGELHFEGKAPGIPKATIFRNALGLSKDQLKKQSEIQALSEVQADALQHAVRNGELPENSKTAQQLRAECQRFMLEVLTPEQRAKLDKMEGKKCG